MSSTYLKRQEIIIMAERGSKVIIEMVDNGYIVTSIDQSGTETESKERGMVTEERRMVVEDREQDGEAMVAERLMLALVDVLGLAGDKFDRERIFITTAAGHKYEPRKDEKIVRSYYNQVVKKPVTKKQTR